jgi:uncharacterized glyoxalase superfamily protein PhnB
MSSLFAYLSYRDAPAAIDWLEAIGLQVVIRQPGNDGTVLHAELRLGDAVVMLASADADYTVPPLVGRSTGSGLYLLVGDVGAIYGAAIEAGATAVFAPETTEWGTERARVLDPEGHEVIRHLRARGHLVRARAEGPSGPEATTRSRGMSGISA